MILKKRGSKNFRGNTIHNFTICIFFTIFINQNSIDRTVKLTHLECLVENKIINVYGM